MRSQSTAKHLLARRYPKLAARIRAWTPERRARQVALLRRTRPWIRSTGPCTAAGKAVSARNGVKPGCAARRGLQAAMAAQRRLLTLVNRARKVGLMDTKSGRTAFFAGLRGTDLAIERVTLALYDAVFNHRWMDFYS